MLGIAGWHHQLPTSLLMFRLYLHGDHQGLSCPINSASEHNCTAFNSCVYVTPPSLRYSCSSRTDFVSHSFIFLCNVQKLKNNTNVKLMSENMPLITILGQWIWQHSLRNHVFTTIDIKHIYRGGNSVDILYQLCWYVTPFPQNTSPYQIQVDNHHIECVVQSLLCYCICPARVAVGIVS